jgi:transposase
VSEAVFRSSVFRLISESQYGPTCLRRQKESQFYWRRRPKSLKRRGVVYHLAEAQRHCPECQGELKHIGEEISERLEYAPASPPHTWVRRTDA